MPSSLRSILAGALGAATVACGGASSSAPSPSGSTPGGSAGFAGTYATAVSLVQSSCGTITVQNNPTVVTHDAATGAITMTHAGTTYSGFMKADSTFVTTPRAVDVNDGYAYSIGITGRFRARAFDASATVDRTGQGAACQFVVRWAGTR